ncbi:long-chain fatty acid--CoA ligase [Nocardia puris]|uniref:AMP-dependent synthetase/ligase n=1 Tax=Nocardia puris TaxID=208602 RepID=UPI0018939001|nr:AMP-dependent synthetase/ligase [Nocardia puris]MBF6209941.1 long-chain fatty acid--CoA ligase [Nocardia puris]MBF6368133.1 long-chain fatty acid--CoA ligase [Nocardia puris]MBF6458148.1 long-chain fatty acid--CoA ligase [Nocardia puris]
MAASSTTAGRTRPRTLCAAFQSNVARYGDAVALRTLGGAQTLTWREYGERVRAIATGLRALGLRSGDTVALMLTNRPEFHLCDTAVLHAGATPFSVYNTNPVELLAYQFGNAGNKMVICEKQFASRILEAAALAAEQGHRVEHVIVVDEPVPGTTTLAAVESAPAPEGFDFEATWRAVDPEDLLTIVYTSGTTGPPKGVELTHTNFLENARVIEKFGGGGAEDRVISYLPDAHAANRWFAHYLTMLEGGEITTVADLKQVAAAMTEVRPTVFLGVPRVWVKVRGALEERFAAEPAPRRALIRWAVETGRHRARAVSDGIPEGPADRLRHAVAERLVLRRLRERLGLDRVRVAVTGSVAIPPDVHEFFLGLGLPLCEGYGMTECTAGATLNGPERVKIGTVGTPLPGAEVRLADDGEVLIRGRMVMRGYRGDPEKTAETVDAEGWLHTGDIGSFDADGYLRIVDRKKELIINAAGKNMSPANIENTVTDHCALAGAVAVIGEQRPYNTALICLDPDLSAAFATRAGLSATGVGDLARDPQVLAEIERGVAAANAKLSRVEQIKKFRVLGETWEPGGACLTATGKLRRTPIAARYAETIEAMYSA